MKIYRHFVCSVDVFGNAEFLARDNSVCTVISFVYMRRLCATADVAEVVLALAKTSLRGLFTCSHRNEQLSFHFY